MRAYVTAALEAAAEGREVPFATIERSSGRVVGSTRYLAPDAHHRRLEIGYTWLASAWQRRPVQQRGQAAAAGSRFRRLGALRVEFKTDSLNERSRVALLGNRRDRGRHLRNHMVTDSGRRRHSVYFSVIEEEWPSVRRKLEARLARLARRDEGGGTDVKA